MLDNQYEIDFLPVGDGSRSGDAIALRYGYAGNQVIHVVDGGTTVSGEALVRHIRQHYGNPSRIDHVVLTHPDDDHSSGLRVLFQHFEIGALWMNRPWLYAQALVPLYQDQRWTADGLEGRLRRDFPITNELEVLAFNNGTPVYEAFQGTMIGRFEVTSPTIGQYIQLVPQFSRGPAPASEGQQNRGLLGNLIEKARNKAEEWNIETLSNDTPGTSPSNESSVVQFARIGGKKLLLTGDVGIDGLQSTIDYLAPRGDLPGLDFIQIPHHGSRRNVTPIILNGLLGRPALIQINGHFNAFASVAAGNEDMPKRIVCNAFTRRGARVNATKGNTIYAFGGLEMRPGWSGLVAYELFPEVEDYDQ